ncbi:MAG: hypothetical protein WBA45_04590 [Microthrixaceae bacterium]
MSTRSTTSGADLHPEGRRGHSIVSAIRDFFLVWYAMLAGILLWAIHLVALSSLVQLACNSPGTEWITHMVTAVTLAGTVLAIVLSVRLLRLGKEQLGTGDFHPGNFHPDDFHPDDFDSGSTPPERLVFMGRFGILIGAISALLIVMEEVYAVALHSTTCA